MNLKDDIQALEAEIDEMIGESLGRSFDRGWYLSGCIWCLAMAALVVVNTLLGTEAFTPFVLLAWAGLNGWEWRKRLPPDAEAPPAPRA
jgi:predicted membrane metal-binding protein